jgi:tRNA pseudouridine13 synthase
MKSTKHYTYPHAPLSFEFRQTPERFFVEEIPLAPFSGKGNYLIIKIQKEQMSTSRLLSVLSKATELKEREIGYAGLKDKSATTIQYFSLPKASQKLLHKNLSTPRVKILQEYLHKAPIKIGDLSENHFKITLAHVSLSDAKKIDTLLPQIENKGIPNYFGYQRFGEDALAYLQGKEIAHSGKRLKGSREKLLVSAYQSHLFNAWLDERIRISRIIAQDSPNASAKKLHYPLPLTQALKKQPQFFKLFLGDILARYPYGRDRVVKDLHEASHAFLNKEVAPTGLLCGQSVKRSHLDAYHLEAPYDDKELYTLRGDRRLAWVFPTNLEGHYDPKERRYRLCFGLPKGSYATTLLEEIGKFPLKVPRD